MFWSRVVLLQWSIALCPVAAIRPASFALHLDTVDGSRYFEKWNINCSEKYIWPQFEDSVFMNLKFSYEKHKMKYCELGFGFLLSGKGLFNPAFWSQEHRVSEDYKRNLLMHQMFAVGIFFSFKSPLSIADIENQAKITFSLETTSFNYFLMLFYFYKCLAL